MSTISPSPAAKKLIQAFSTISSTEDLILFVAGTDKMLPFCQELLEQYDRDTLALLTLEVNSLCAAQGILPGLLYSEIRKVLIALNSFHDNSLDHFATLGLQKSASITEVKKTYRQLSKLYHPDMVQNKDKDAQRFMEISGAYHAIMAAHSGDHSLPGPKSWRKKNKNLKTKRRFNQRAFLFTVIPLIIALVWISLYVSKKYDEQIIFSRMQSSPASESYSSVKTLEPVENKVNKTFTPEVLPDNSVARQTPDAQSMDTLSSLPEADPEAPVIFSSEEETISLPPQGTHQNDLATVEEIPSPDTAEAEKHVIPIPMSPPVKTSQPEQQSTIQQVTQIEKAEPTDEEPLVRPIPKVVPDGKKYPAAVKQPEQPEQPEQELNREKILSEYVRMYNAKDMDHFLALFHQDATENGQLQSLLIEQYRSFFAHTEAVDLMLEAVNWQEYKDGYEAKSKFTANYTYKDGRSKEHTGDITFYLTNKQGNLKIQSLDYVFLN